MASPLKGRAVAKAIEVIIPRGSCEDVLSSPPRVNQPSRGSGRARAKAVAEQNFAACAQLQKDVEAAKVRCQRPTPSLPAAAAVWRLSSSVCRGGVVFLVIGSRRDVLLWFGWV